MCYGLVQWSLLTYVTFCLTLIFVVGYGLGAAIGLFSSSVGPTATNVEQQTAREVFREMKTTTLSYAKNFAVIGAIFTSVECAIETVSRLQCRCKNLTVFF